MRTFVGGLHRNLAGRPSLPFWWCGRAGQGTVHGLDVPPDGVHPREPVLCGYAATVNLQRGDGVDQGRLVASDEGFRRDSWS